MEGRRFSIHPVSWIDERLQLFEWNIFFLAERFVDEDEISTVLLHELLIGVEHFDPVDFPVGSHIHIQFVADSNRLHFGRFSRKPR